MYPFVTVIIPVLNAADGLDACIESLESQSYPRDMFEIVVVDNAAAAGGNLGRVYPRCRVFRESTVGSYAARNCGIRHARGAVIAFTDADCVADEHWLSAGVRELTRFLTPTIIGGHIARIPLPNDALTIAALYDRTFYLRQDVHASRGHFAITANLFTSRQMFDRVGLFNCRLMSGGDFEWGRRATETGARIIYLPTAIVLHADRSTVRSVAAKSRRVAGGLIQLELEAERGWRSHAKAVFSEARRARSKIAQAKCLMQRLGPRRATSLWLLIVAVQVIRALEMFRILIGGRPTRT
jgi:glycosyltransferase involved in cell wall biosynthesis